MSHERLKVDIAVSVNGRAMGYIEAIRTEENDLEVDANIDNRDPNWADGIVMAEAAFVNLVKGLKESEEAEEKDE